MLSQRNGVGKGGYRESVGRSFIWPYPGGEPSLKVILDNGSSVDTVIEEDFIVAYATVDEQGRSVGRVHVHTDMEFIGNTLEHLASTLYENARSDEERRHIVGELMNLAMVLNAKGTA